MNYTITLALLVIVLAGCSNKDTPPPGVSNNTQLITSSAWKYDNAGLDLDKNGTIDVSVTGQLQACQLDNFLTLSTNGTGVANEGATKCDPSAPQTVAVTWGFASNETVLNISGGGIISGIGGNFKILSLTSTKLSLSKDTTVGLSSYAFVADLKH